MCTALNLHASNEIKNNTTGLRKWPFTGTEFVLFTFSRGSEIRSTVVVTCKFVTNQVGSENFAESPLVYSCLGLQY